MSHVGDEAALVAAVVAGVAGAHDDLRGAALGRPLHRAAAVGRHEAQVVARGLVVVPHHGHQGIQVINIRHLPLVLVHVDLVDAVSDRPPLGEALTAPSIGRRAVRSSAEFQELVPRLGHVEAAGDVQPEGLLLENLQVVAPLPTCEAQLADPALVPEGWEELAVALGVDHDELVVLREVASAGGGARGLLGGEDRRHEERGQHDGDAGHCEKLDQGETTPRSDAHGSHGRNSLSRMRFGTPAPCPARGGVRRAFAPQPPLVY